MEVFLAADIFLSQIVSATSSSSGFEAIVENYMSLLGESDEAPTHGIETSENDGTNFIEPGNEEEEEDSRDENSTKNPPGRSGSVWEIEDEAETALVNNCDYLCWIGFTSHIMLLALHLFVNTVQLSAWAEGNIFLIWGTIWYIFMTFWDVGLILNLDYFYELARWKRIVPWAFSLMFACYYYIGLFTEIAKLTAGETW